MVPAVSESERTEAMAMTDHMPVFLLSYERSGTNLLRRTVGGHSVIVAPPPAHLLNWLTPYEHLYGDLGRQTAFRQLVRDALRITRLPFEPWPEMGGESTFMDMPERERSLLSLFRSLHDRFARERTAHSWFCKDRFLSKHAWALAQIPGARFIVLARDPRDVFVSFRKLAGGPKHPAVFATKWADEFGRILRFSRSPEHRDRTLEVHYESLVRTPEAVAHQICSFLGVGFETSMLSTDHVSSTAVRNSYWSNLGQDFMTDNVNRYRDLLSDGSVGMIESVAGDEMKLLGYELEEPRASMSRLAKRLHWAQDGLLRFLARRRKVSESEEATVRARQAFRAELRLRDWQQVRAEAVPFER